MSQLFQFPEICITEASAGSGKTYALAKRYVQLLLQTARDNPQSYKNILAITFTNKASLEMKTRVLSLLKKIALNQLGKDEEKGILGSLGMTSQQVQVLAFGLMESLIHHYHFFAVKTIDSFINAMLAGCAFKINLSARFKIQRSSADYLEQSLDQWIALSHQNAKIRGLLDDFVHQYLFLENRSGWFPKEDLLEVLKVLFGEFNTYQKSFITFGVESRDLYLAKKDFLELCSTICSLADLSMNKSFLSKLSEFVQEHPVSFDLDDLSKYFSYPEFPANKGIEVGRDLEKVWTKAHNAARDLCLAESYGVFNPYVLIFQNVQALLAGLCSDEDILFLEELNKKASLLMDEGISVSELQYRLSARFQHYLIDEFQDTSMSQCQNLLPMLQEALSTGGSLFLVGDKKQAIYSFRGGESRLFDHLPQVLSNAPVRRDYLTKNWRSHKAIVEFNNKIFSAENIIDMLDRRADYYQQKKSSDEIFFGEEAAVALQAPFEHAHQEVREDMPHGYVSVEHIEGQKKQEREEMIKVRLFEIVADVRSRFKLKDIAILTRSNGQVEQITAWLLSQGIFAQSDRTSDIKNHPLIVELVDFLRFLNSPTDNVSFARFLLGEILPKVCGLSQEELQAFLFDCRLKKTALGEQYLYKEFQGRYPHIWDEYFEEFFNQVGIYPVYELVVSIYDRFRLKGFEEAQGFFMHFLEMIKRREEFSCDIETFIHYFDELQNEERFVPMPVSDAIKVTTVHKSKGLQYEVVIIPFLEMTLQTSKGSQGSLSYVLDSSDEGLRMLRLKKTYGRFSERLKNRYEQEYRDSFAVELNNVYVALTRAVSEMYVMIPERTGNSINPVQFLIPADISTQGLKLSFAKPIENPVPMTTLDASFNRQWVSQLKEDFPFEDRQKTQLRLQGVIMHFCLSQIIRIDSPMADLVAKVIEKARIHLGQMVDARFYAKQLSDFLSRPDVSRFFESQDDVEILCEQEIINRFGDAKRIDRLMIFKDKIWVVDFKTSKAEEDEQKKQMKEYEELVSQLYPKHRVEGFLVYLN
ncbi:MAG: UvrD-helicase domain-containing protein [Candidatus Omnitrophica bacterium]|nr:UvrD-helicase domain-containing protein [Candidatus Omnitrophota bacterium]